MPGVSRPPDRTIQVQELELDVDAAIVTSKAGVQEQSRLRDGDDLIGGDGIHDTTLRRYETCQPHFDSFRRSPQDLLVAALGSRDEGVDHADEAHQRRERRADAQRGQKRPSR